MKRSNYRTLMLMLPILAILIGVGATTVQQPFSTTVVPSNSNGQQCSYGKHGATRGRPIFYGMTLVADDGCPLVGASMYDFSDGTFNGCATNLAWWQQMHDQGHFNVIRVMAYTGQWWDSGLHVQTLDQALGLVDQEVALAAQTGMYVLLDYHGNGNLNQADTTDFWNAAAPRYANNTNVIYEFWNEPTRGGSADPSFEGNGFLQLRAAAPNTPVVLWSVDNPNTWMNGSLAQQTTGAAWPPALYGWHGYYDGTGDILNSLEVGMNQAGYPTYMTEWSAQNSPGYVSPPLSWMLNRIAAGKPTNFLGTGILQNGVANGCPSGSYALDVVQINWPAD
jgi:Cellulase (glycosyl hydrolase family 5)